MRQQINKRHKVVKDGRSSVEWCDSTILITEPIRYIKHCTEFTVLATVAAHEMTWRVWVICGCDATVAYLLAKQEVEGSNPFTHSIDTDSNLLQVKFLCY
mgnify:CR=1 FL=1